MQAPNSKQRTRFVQVSTTVDSNRAATEIATQLLKKRLTSCVQIIGPFTSHYWWKGNIQTTREWFCFIKSRAEHFNRIEAAIKAVHPYDVPEILAFPIIRGNREYLEWVQKETDHSRSGKARIRGHRR